MMKVIIIVGPPGSGKGTQSELLAAKFNLYYFETSAILERSIAEAKKGDFVKVEGKKYFFEKQGELWKKGILLDPPFVAHLVQQKIKELAKEKKGIVFSGSPRTLYEGRKITPLIEDLYGKENIKVVFLKLSPEQTIWRNSHRRICELMRHPILWVKETMRLKNCPLDGSKLIKRKGLDDPETIKTRLKEYKERTFPLLEFFKKKGLKVKKVNGEQSVVGVHRDVLRAISKR